MCHKKKVLHLSVKRKYFEQIKSGEKVEEFRLAKDYWSKRLENKTFDEIVIKSGYPKLGESARTLIRPWRGYVMRTIVHEEFGAGPVTVFAIKVNEG